MNPEVRIVLGVKVVSKQEEIRHLKGQKYDENTGKPYPVYEVEYCRPDPKWFAGAFEAQDESDEPWVDDGELGFVISDCEEIFFVGKLLKTIDPPEFGDDDVFSLDMQELLSKDRYEVMAFIRKLGATEFGMEDIKLWFSTKWV